MSTTTDPHDSPSPVPAPTRHETATNPGKYEGTSFDPTLGVMHPQLYERFGAGGAMAGQGPMTWAEWYRLDPGSAIRCFEDPGQFGEPINMSALGPDQRRRMGLG